MDELGKLKARRQRQARAVVRLEREVTALRNRGGPQTSLEALESVLSRHRETLRQLSAGIDATEPKPHPCRHSGAVRVELSTGELAAWLCPDWFTSTEVVYGVTGTDVIVLPEYGVSP
jgi:hypothetical protein